MALEAKKKKHIIIIKGQKNTHKKSQKADRSTPTVSLTVNYPSFFEESPKSFGKISVSKFMSFHLFSRGWARKATSSMSGLMLDPRSTT